jgi:RimJ/RimL family protein N-acetyltransferase
MSAPDVVTTHRLHGRRLTLEAADYMALIDRDTRVQATMFGTRSIEPAHVRLQRLLEMWDLYGFGLWLFSDAEGEPVGHGGLYPSPRLAGEIEAGCALKPEHWRRGYGGEIVSKTIAVGFECLHLERIIAFARASNATSRRLMERCGMVFEAHARSPDGTPGVRYAIERRGTQRPASVG